MTGPSFAERMWRADAVRAETSGGRRGEARERTVPVDLDAVTRGTEVRLRIAELVHRAAIGGERLVLTRDGRSIAVLAPVADLARIDELELRCDAAELRAALAEAGADADADADAPLTLAAALGGEATDADRAATMLRLHGMAASALRGIAAARRGRLLQALHALDTDPRPPGSQPLPGPEGARRLRAGPWHILYRQVAGTAEVVAVVAAPGQSCPIPAPANPDTLDPDPLDPGPLNPGSRTGAR